MVVIAKGSTEKFCRTALLFASLTLAGTLANAQNFIINGLGEYREFNKPTLMIKLDLAVPTEDALEAVSMDVPKQLSFRMLEDRSARRWSQIWIQNLSINSPPAVLTKQTDDLIRMTQAIPSTLLQGDLVEFERVANDLTLMIVDGVEVAEFQTPDFFEFLLSAFIGPVPPSSELKSSLLQAGDVNSEANTLFTSLGYSNERSNTVASWLKPIAPEPEPEPIEIVEETESSEEVADLAEGLQKQLLDEQEEAEEQANSSEISAIEVTEAELASEQVEGTVDTIEEDATDPIPESEVLAEPLEVAAMEVESEVEVAEEEDAPLLITADSLLAVQNYQREILLKIYENMEYPRSAQRRNQEGTLRVSIAVNKDGSLENIELLQQTEHESLNEAALAAVDDASPFNGLPESILDLPMTVEIPIQFRLQ